MFSPLDGPPAATAYQQVRRLWTACRSQLGMTEAIPGIAAATLPPETHAALRPDRVAAAQERSEPAGKPVLRRVHDVVNLSVALAQPKSEGLRRPAGMRLPSERPMGWVEWAQIWSQASAPGPGAAWPSPPVLARAPAAGIGTVAATAELGQSLDSLLPYREDRARGMVAAGHHDQLRVCGVGPEPGGPRTVPAKSSSSRPRTGTRSSAHGYGRDETHLPPFARYLLHAARLRVRGPAARCLGAGPA